MLPYTNFEADRPVGAANDHGHRHPSVLGPSPSPELIEWHIAKARRLRAEFCAQAARRLVSALSDRFSRARARRRILAALGPRSPHLLEDIGLGGDQLSERVAALVAEKRSRREEDKRWRDIERQVRRELMAYSDRELDDLGIRRVDIPRIARSHMATGTNLAGAAANTNAAPAETGVRDRSA